MAPALVQICVGTWRRYSGIQDIRLLDLRSVLRHLNREELPRTFESLPVQMKSDAIRLALLARYGGIWLDASTLVTGTVHDYVQEATRGGGFFAFQNGEGGTGGRLFEIGVLAATPENPFVVEWSASFNEFFARERIHFAHSPKGPASRGVKLVFGLLNRYLRVSPSRSTLWVRTPLRSLPFYPYFVSYYLANRLVLKRDFSTTLQRMKFESAGTYLWFRNELNHGRGPTGVRELLQNGQVLSDVEFRTEVSDEDLASIRSSLGL